jgi:hypothetical protein
MRSRIAIAIVSLLCTLAFVVPANAIVINGVKYVLFANEGILMEQGDTEIAGNVGVNSATGVMEIGANNRIVGTATAHSILRGSNSLTDICRYDVTSGGGVCSQVLPPGSVPIVNFPIVNWPAIPNLPAIPPAPVPCVPGTAVSVTAANSPLHLNTGCYTTLRVNPDKVLNLSAGNYFFTGEVRLRNQSTLNGAGATVNAAGHIVTEPSVNINDVTLNSAGSGGNVVHIGNGSKVSNARIYAPAGEMHLHTNMEAAPPFDAIANRIIVEPIKILPPGCGCFDELTKSNSTVTLSEGTKLSLANAFFLSTNCDPTGFLATPQSVTDGTVVLNVAGAPPGTYHVIAHFFSGSYCSTQTITIP